MYTTYTHLPYTQSKTTSSHDAPTIINPYPTTKSRSPCCITFANLPIPAPSFPQGGPSTNRAYLSSETSPPTHIVRIIDPDDPGPWLSSTRIDH
ncbi:hypothetical protein DSO57_1006587 [Entomophthora muscae]|uniref:Uncharacterized protein n=1 Tax=Entomophthora muscae TaxID=34485 RepID=A0ACC2SK82_9FUNG|nr:hypothetical protein DSO57_1006587 [Entomophthora muscae]